MKLIEPLASGIRGAEIGSVVLLRRGTSTNATYYTDFEFQQQYSASPIALDSNGGAVLYVNELVDVIVRDANGVIVREFVAGENATSVEVISQSFTGVDYEDGSSGANKPTTLANILDLWKTSSGTIDFKVLFNGTPTLLQNAFSATFFNVRSYGAVGNGVADDRTAIITAQAAAVAAGGGVVFFPAGTYRITSAITPAGGVTWLGCGGQSTKIAIDSAVASGILVLPGNAAGQLTLFSGLWFGLINGASPGVAIVYNAASSGEFHFTDCVLGIDSTYNSSLVAGFGGTALLSLVFTRCYFKLVGTTAQLITCAGSQRLIVRDCDLINTNVVGVNMVDCQDNGVFEGNRFDWSSATAGPGIKYLNITPSVNGAIFIVGNQFAANASIACIAIYNTMAVPFRDALEYGNMFGNMLASGPGCTPYGYATDGYAPSSGFVAVGGHLTRLARCEGYSTAAGAQNVDPKTYGTTTILKTGGGNLTVVSGGKGSMGDRWTLHIKNTTGAPITVAGTGIIFDPAVAPLPINNNGFAEVQLAWLPDFAGASGGFWYQVGKAVLS